jgi:hypothetical protein
MISALAMVAPKAFGWSLLTSSHRQDFADGPHSELATSYC